MSSCECGWECNCYEFVGLGEDYGICGGGPPIKKHKKPILPKSSTVGSIATVYNNTTNTVAPTLTRSTTNKDLLKANTAQAHKTSLETTNRSLLVENSGLTGEVT